MAKPSAAFPARPETRRPSRSLSKAVQRRAAAVSQKLASRGLGAFVWHKKLDRDLSRGLVPEIVSIRAERRRCLARRTEAAGVKACADASRRGSPPPIVAASSFARAAEEAAFLLQQSRLRAEARLASVRPKPIDVLVKSLDGTRPRALAAFRGASAEELKELGEEIAAHADIDGANGPFWAAAKAICDAEIEKEAAGHGAITSLHSAVLADVRAVVDGKSVEELDAMENAISAQMATGEAKVVEHWQEVMELIQVAKARKFLEQHYSTSDDAPPSHDKNDDQPERAHADEEGPEEALRPVALPARGPEWRKPKYVARVRSGFEWNKYNRAHYDHDHPPPKTVRGYKFVVYYPDLAGAKPPQYTVNEDVVGDGGETCILRFHAGWPYEDVAFRIVNKEWEYSRKAGFRCTFDDRGILHLNFQFKRFFYKR